MNKIIKNIWLERICFIIVGLLIGYIYTINQNRERIEFFEKLTFNFGEISYYRGCADNAIKSHDCKEALKNYKKDNIDISNNFDEIIAKKK